MKKKSILDRFKKDLENKEEYKKALFFLFYFILFFTISYFIFSHLFYSYINYFYGYISSVILTNIFNVSTLFVFDKINTTSILVIPTVKESILIGFLCTGTIEFCLLSSAILASKGIAIKKRIYGFLASIPIVIIFNIIRITTTAYIIATANLLFAEIVHGFLFRFFLIIMVLGVYFFWFKLASE